MRFHELADARENDASGSTLHSNFSQTHWKYFHYCQLFFIPNYSVAESGGARGP